MALAKLLALNPQIKRYYAVKCAEPWSSAWSRLGASIGRTKGFGGEIPATL